MVYYDGHLSPYPDCAGRFNIGAKGCRKKSAAGDGLGSIRLPIDRKRWHLGAKSPMVPSRHLAQKVAGHA
jgi:hypothetical protein